ncbi:MAG TPA: type II secretion system protein GspE, partial [Candidatus Paceibacterota bacterium]|nr:type II secretion system protein GspE [Candidatus Paceibacterota bacterium]
TLDKEERAKIAHDDKFEAALKALTEEKLVKEGTSLGELAFHKPMPSSECEEGYKGRIGIHEVLSVSTAVRDLILHSGTSEQIEEQARKEGMLTMLEDGLYKAGRGTTSIEEVLRAVTE